MRRRGWCAAQELLRMAWPPFSGGPHASVDTQVLHPCARKLGTGRAGEGGGIENGAPTGLYRFRPRKTLPDRQQPQSTTALHCVRLPTPVDSAARIRQLNHPVLVPSEGEQSSPTSQHAHSRAARVPVGPQGGVRRWIVVVLRPVANFEAHQKSSNRATLLGQQKGHPVVGP